MVQLMSSLGEKAGAVKLEVGDDVESLESQLSPLHKRCKPDPYLQMENVGMCNPLVEPPLGLRLKKSPSFLDLIQMKLSQDSSSSMLLSKKDHKMASNTADKLKASNFPASLLKIGTWEYKSRYEGDLVAKLYFAKHKLVWEVLDGGLKNKIEIQWSDIVAIKAYFPDDGPETLDVVLGRRPLFFRETNPQPRKHTLWQATSDFTDGKASIYRQHFLQCQQGFLGKHFEKLIQCDPRLKFLSRQAESLLECPFFEQRVPAFVDLNKSNRGSDLKAEAEHVVLSLLDVAPSSGSLSPTFSNEGQSFITKSPENSMETPSPSSARKTTGIEALSRTGAAEHILPSHWDQIKVPGIQTSMSMSDLVNHIGQCISAQMASANPILSGRYQKSSEILEEITQYLLSDSQLTSASDEQSLMARVNSLCCLLQKDPGAAQNFQAKSLGGLVVEHDGKMGETNSISEPARQSRFVEGFLVPEDESNSVSGCKQTPAMSRKDSVGELLLNLPRIASLPQFLCNI